MCNIVHENPHAMHANSTTDKLRVSSPATHQELPEVLDNYWISAYSRAFHITVHCWTSEISALGLSTALPPAQKTGDFSIHIRRTLEASDGGKAPPLIHR